MKRFLIGTVLVLLALAVIVFLGGSLLPRTHRATSTILLHQQPDTIWTLIRNPEAVATYWTDVDSVRRMPADTGERWMYWTGGFEMPFEIVSSHPPAELVTHIVETPDAHFGGDWTYTLAATPNGTRVTVTEDGWVGNPAFRVMTRVMGEHRTVDRMLTALGRHFGEDITPEHVEHR